jgi:hypothetical protein
VIGVVVDSIYTSFLEVERATEAGHFKNESELRQAVVEALKNELSRSRCSKNIVSYVLTPLLDRTIQKKRPDIRFGNIVIEVESPKAELTRGRDQLQQYVERLASLIKESPAKEFVVHGVVTNGFVAEYYKFDVYSKHLSLEKAGGLSEVMRYVLDIFCSEKIPVVTSEDLVDLLGV